MSKKKPRKYLVIDPYGYYIVNSRGSVLLKKHKDESVSTFLKRARKRYIVSMKKT